MAQLNWLDFLQKGQWKPQPLLKVEELKEGRQKVRDINRIRAIEESKAKGVDASGNLDPSKIRESLFAQGFGGDADAVVNQVAAQREGASKLKDEGMLRNFQMVQMGLMSPEKYNELHYNTYGTYPSNIPTSTQPKTEQQILQETQDIFGNISPSETVSQTPQLTPAQILESKKKDSSKVGEVTIVANGDKPSETFDLSSMPDSTMGTSETRFSKRSAQMSPDYLAEEGDVRNVLSQSSGGFASGNLFSYEMPESGVRRSYSIDAANQTLGTAIKDDKNAKTLIDSRISQMAEAQFPVKPFSAFKSYPEFLSYQAERTGNIAKTKAEIIQKISNEANMKFDQSVKRDQEARAEKGEIRAEKAQAVSTDPLTPDKNQILARNVTPTELEKIKDYRKAYVNFQNATKSFEDALDAAIAKSKVDGSVQWDVIVGNLVSMGAWPSSDAVALKQNLDPQIPVSKMVLLSVLDEGKKLGKYADFFEKPKGASQEWVNKNVKELNSALVDAGGKPFNAKDQVDVKRSTKESSSKPESKKSGWYKDADGVMRNH